VQAKTIACSHISRAEFCASRINARVDTEFFSLPF
jgi:hypothetical protein